MQRIREPEDVLRLFGPRLRDLQVEEFHLLALDSQSQVLARGADHPGAAEQLAGASARSVPSRHRRGGGRNHRGAQPSQWRSDPLGGRPGGHQAAGGGRPAARSAGVRPRDHCRRPIRELCQRQDCCDGNQDSCDRDAARARPRPQGRARAARRPARPRADRPGAPLQRVRAPGPEADVRAKISSPTPSPSP